MASARQFRTLFPLASFTIFFGISTYSLNQSHTVLRLDILFPQVTCIQRTSSHCPPHQMIAIIAQPGQVRSASRLPAIHLLYPLGQSLHLNDTVIRQIILYRSAFYGIRCGWQASSAFLPSRTGLSLLYTDSHIPWLQKCRLSTSDAALA